MVTVTFPKDTVFWLALVYGRRAVYNGFPEVGLRCRDLNWTMRSIFEDLCNRSYEAVLSHNPTNDWVHERGLVGKIAQPRLRIAFQLSTSDHSRYRNVIKSVNRRPLLWSHGVSLQLSGINERFFDSSLDRVMKTIGDLAFYFGVEEVLKCGLIEVHETAWSSSLRLIIGVGVPMLKF